MRNAGDATRFRVIKRIPQPDTVEIATLAWPYPDAARRAVENDDWVAAWAALQALPRDKDPRFAFLWSWSALQSQAFDQAQEGFADIAQSDSLFTDYANLYAAEAAFGAKRFDDAVTHAARVQPRTVPHRSASLVMARALVAGGDADKGIRALRAFIDAFAHHDDAALARTELARALHARGEDLDAAKLLARVRIETPLWDGLDEEFKALEESVTQRLNKKDRAKAFRRDTADWLTEYRTRFRAHDSDDVIAGLKDRVLKWNQGTTERCEGLFLVGNSYTKLRKHKDSTPWYERIITECKGDKHYIRALYKGAKGHWNAGRKDAARRMFEQMWEEFPKHSYADDGMYFASRILAEQDKTKEAKSLLERQVQTYPAGDMAADAHWSFVREHLMAKRYGEAVKYIDSIEDRGEDDLYSEGRLAYFRARALQLSGDVAGARKAYAGVAREHPMGYYALLALNRLADMVGPKTKATDVCKLVDGALCRALASSIGPNVSVDAELRTNESYRRGVAFLQVALDGFAQLEFNRLRRQVGDDPERLWALAALLDAAGAYPFSHNIARREIDGWENFYPDKAAPQWGIGYPAPFASQVRSWAKKRGLPPALVWGIMREESGFNPRIKSWAGAIGLMQVMPGTAKVSAKKDNFTDFAVDQLTDPDAALRIGTAYLDELADESGSHPVLMISGYNGGWGNVGRWLKDPDSRDLDIWVEDIPYGQTRNYTKRVLRSMWIYGWLRDGDRVPRFSMTVPEG